MNDSFIYATTASFLSANAPKTEEQKCLKKDNERFEEWLEKVEKEIKKAAKDGLNNVCVSTKPGDPIDKLKYFLLVRGYTTYFDDYTNELTIQWTKYN